MQSPGSRSWFSSQSRSYLPTNRGSLLMNVKAACSPHPFQPRPLSLLVAASSPAAGPRSTMANPDFTKGDKIPDGREPRLEPRGHRGPRVDVQRQARDHRRAADRDHQGGEGFSRRRDPRGRRRDPRRRRQAVLLRPAHRTGQGAHHGRIGGGWRKLVADPLAGRQDRRRSS